MFIAEIFYSIQGEGELLGTPSIFVRTSGCNLRCSWCDTPYTSWQPEGKETSVTDIVRQVQQYPGKYVVLTGGEPLLAPGIHHLAQELKQRDYHITIETAATIPPHNIACDLASLSPKLKNSLPDDTHWREKHEKLRYRPRVIRSWIAQGGYQLKFVIASPEDITEIEKILSEIEALDTSRVYLMPEGITTETLREKSKWLVNICMEKGFRYAPRLHIELFGQKRGT